MQIQDILYEVSDGIATLTLNRPDARNAYSEEMIDSIVYVLDLAEEDDSVRCLIITGAGGAFSAGGDIKLMLDHEGMFEGDPVRLRSRYKRGIQRIPRRLDGHGHGVLIPVRHRAFALAERCYRRVEPSIGGRDGLALQAQAGKIGAKGRNAGRGLCHPGCSVNKGSRPARSRPM
jgi:hypothetical protein